VLNTRRRSIRRSARARLAGLLRDPTRQEIVTDNPLRVSAQPLPPGRRCLAAPRFFYNADPADSVCAPNSGGASLPGPAARLASPVLRFRNPDGGEWAEARPRAIHPQILRLAAVGFYVTIRTGGVVLRLPGRGLHPPNTISRRRCGDSRANPGLGFLAHSESPPQTAPGRSREEGEQKKKSARVPCGTSWPVYPGLGITPRVGQWRRTELSSAGVPMDNPLRSCRPWPPWRYSLEAQKKNSFPPRPPGFRRKPAPRCRLTVGRWGGPDVGHIFRTLKEASRAWRDLRPCAAHVEPAASAWKPLPGRPLVSLRLGRRQLEEFAELPVGLLPHAKLRLPPRPGTRGAFASGSGGFNADDARNCRSPNRLGGLGKLGRLRLRPPGGAAEDGPRPPGRRPRRRGRPREPAWAGRDQSSRSLPGGKPRTSTSPAGAPAVSILFSVSSIPPASGRRSRDKLQSPAYPAAALRAPTLICYNEHPSIVR